MSFFIYSFFERASERVGGLAGAVLKTAVGFVCFFSYLLYVYLLSLFIFTSLLSMKGERASEDEDEDEGRRGLYRWKEEEEEEEERL